MSAPLFGFIGKSYSETKTFDKNIFSEISEDDLETNFLVTKLSNVTEAFREQRAIFGLKDSDNNSMDALQIIQPNTKETGKKLYGVYHSFDDSELNPTLRLAFSENSQDWTSLTELHKSASQGYLHFISEEAGLLLLFEKDNSTTTSGSTESWIEIEHYACVQDLIDKKPTATRKLNRYLSTSNEGTPSIESVKINNNNIFDSEIVIRGHYLREGGVDRQMKLTFKNFEEVRDFEPDNNLNDQIEDYLEGNFGDRDEISDYMIIEGQRRKKDMNSWELILYKKSTNEFYKLDMKTPNKSKSFANPGITKILGQDDKYYLLVTVFIHTKSNWPFDSFSENRQLIYWIPLEDIATPEIKKIY